MKTAKTQQEAGVGGAGAEGGATHFPVFVHLDTGSKSVQVRATDTLETILRQAGISKFDDVHVLVGELPDAPHTDEAEEDEHGPVRPSCTVGESGLGRNGHLACLCCLRIEVEVHYQNRKVHRRFSPTTTVARVTRWARRRFHLTDADAEKFVLLVCGQIEPPRASERLFQIHQSGRCQVCFDLVPDPRING
jgi:hypothetical protein